MDDPRSIGEALRGAELGEFWKYRVGDYRIIARIEDQKVEILVVRIGNRREDYRSCRPPEIKSAISVCKLASAAKELPSGAKALLM